MLATDRSAPRSARSAPTACCTCRACSTSTTSSRCSSRGTNVVTTRGELFGGGHRLGDGRGSACARRVRRAATRRSTRRAAAPGSSPTRCRSRCCRCSAASSRSRSTSSPNLSRRDSPHLLFEQMGFGQPLDVVRPESRRVPRSASSRPSLGAARRGRGPAGRRVDVHRRGRGGAPDDDDARRGRARRPGTVARAADDDRRDRAAAPRSCGSRRTGTAPTDVEPAWDLRPTGWRVRGARRRAARRRPPVPGAARGPRGVHARRTPRTGR